MERRHLRAIVGPVARWLLAVAVSLALTGCDALFKKWRWHAPTPPNPGAAQPGPEVQFEDHTCGYHALRSAYAAYGLSPDEENLRFRLGVDVVAVPWDFESAGTLHPDLFRVLMQDGFGFRSLDLECPQARTQLRDHLQQEQLALALIRRRQNGNMHWVVISDWREGHLRIIDSLHAEPYTEKLDSFFEDCALSIIPIRPNGGDKSMTISKAQAAGLKEMYRSYARLKTINGRIKGEGTHQ